jgi:hypothetical protein
MRALAAKGMGSKKLKEREIVGSTWYVHIKSVKKEHFQGVGLKKDYDSRCT